MAIDPRALSFLSKKIISAANLRKSTIDSLKQENDTLKKQIMLLESDHPHNSASRVIIRCFYCDNWNIWWERDCRYTEDEGQFLDGECGSTIICDCGYCDRLVCVECRFIDFDGDDMCPVCA